MNKTETKTVYKNSFPLFSIMFLILFTLKITNVINWSWWLVTAPLWGPLVVAILLVIGIVLFATIVSLFIK